MAAPWFISESQFKEKVESEKELNRIYNWAEVDQSVVYNILSIEVKDSEDYDNVYIGTFQDKYLEIIRVWLTSILVKDLRLNRKPTERAYIICLGQERFKKTKRFNKYELTYEEAGVLTPIFEDEISPKP